MKKLLAFMLAAAMTLSLVACGGDNGPAAGGSSSSSSGGSSNPGSSGSSAGSSQDSSQEPSQEPEKEFTTATVGETVTLEGDIELTTSEFQSDAEKLGGNISVSTHSDSNKYFWLLGTMTNVGKETISSWSVDCMVNIIFDDDYTYEGSLNIRDDMGPFAESEVLFWADVPPAMLDRYQTVKVQFAYNDGFADYNWEAANYEKNMDGYDHKYEFVQGSGGGGAAAQAGGGSEAASGIWSVNYYVDDFQQPTDEWYITANTSFSGTFSNSATTNSKLAVQVAVDAEDVAFFLYEYGRSQVKNPSSNYVDEYDITMRTADGTDHSLSGTVYCGGDRLMIEGKDMDTVLAAMKDGGTISFHIVESDRTTTSYLFSLEASNFSQVYEEMAG